MTIDLLIELGWKSALLSGAALGLNAMLRQRPATERADLLRLSLCLIPALPLLSALLPALVLEALPAVPRTAPTAIPAIVAAQPVAARAAWSWSELVVIFYALVALCLLTRTAIGIAILLRWTKSATSVANPHWQGLLTQMTAGRRRNVRLMTSPHVRAPLSLGILRPVILLAPGNLHRPEEAEGILAHELAHIHRLDWPMLVLSRTATALFWFNPLIWILVRMFERSSEEAADHHALSRVEPATYASILLTAARQEQPLKIANAMAFGRGTLAKRINLILRNQRDTAYSRVRTMGAGGVVLGATISLSALQIVPAQAAPVTMELPTSPTHPVVPHGPSDTPAPQAQENMTQNVPLQGEEIDPAPSSEGTRTNTHVPVAPAASNNMLIADPIQMSIDTPMNIAIGPRGPMGSQSSRDRQSQYADELSQMADDYRDGADEIEDSADNPKIRQEGRAQMRAQASAMRREAEGFDAKAKAIRASIGE